MSSELYDKFVRINRIDQAIFESEQEIANGAEAVDAEIVFAELEKKYYWSREPGSQNREESKNVLKRE